MFRDKCQVALDEAIVSLQNEAAHSLDAAQRLDDPDLSALLRDSATRCEAFAERLKPDMEALHDLPSEPDQEAEILEGLMSRIQAAFAGDGRTSVLRERISGMEYVQERLRAVVDTQPPPVILDHVRAALDFARAAQARLREITRSVR